MLKNFLIYKDEYSDKESQHKLIRLYEKTYDRLKQFSKYEGLKMVQFLKFVINFINEEDFNDLFKDSLKERDIKTKQVRIDEDSYKILKEFSKKNDYRMIQVLDFGIIYVITKLEDEKNE